MMHCRHCEAHNGEADSCILSIVTRIHFWDDSCQQHRHHCHQSHHRWQLLMTASSPSPSKPSSTTAVDDSIVTIAIKAFIDDSCHHRHQSHHHHHCQWQHPTYRNSCPTVIVILKRSVGINKVKCTNIWDPTHFWKWRCAEERGKVILLTGVANWISFGLQTRSKATNLFLPLTANYHHCGSTDRNWNLNFQGTPSALSFGFNFNWISPAMIVKWLSSIMV